MHFWGLIIFLILCSFLPFLASDSDAISDSNNSTTNFYNENGFELMYPSNFTRLDPRNITVSSWPYGFDRFLTLVDPATDMKINVSKAYDFEQPINELGASLDDYLTEMLENYLFLYYRFYNTTTFNIEKIDTNSTLGGNKAYRLDGDIRDGDIREVIHVFAKHDDTLYDISGIYKIDMDSHQYKELIEKVINSFNITYSSLKSPPIEIDGKVEPNEWKSDDLKFFDFHLFNTTTYLPTVYQVKLQSTNDDSNVYTLAQITSNQNFSGNMNLELIFQDGNLYDIVRLDNNNKTQLFNGYSDSGMDSIKNDTKINGNVASTFSNGTLNIELKYPLCSSDIHDICITPDKAIRFYFGIDDHDDSNLWPPLNRITDSTISSGIIIGMLSTSPHEACTECMSAITEYVVPPESVLKSYSKLTKPQKEEFISAVGKEQFKSFLDAPTYEDTRYFMDKLLSIN